MQTSPTHLPSTTNGYLKIVDIWGRAELPLHTQRSPSPSPSFWCWQSLVLLWLIGTPFWASRFTGILPASISVFSPFHLIRTLVRMHFQITKKANFKSFATRVPKKRNVSCSLHASLWCSQPWPISSLYSYQPADRWDLWRIKPRELENAPMGWFQGCVLLGV